MIRLATTDDIEYIVGGMLSLKQNTGWAAYIQPGYNEDTLRQFIKRELLNPESVLYMSEMGVHKSAFCGASLQSFYLPPHMPCVLEWGWFGDREGCVRTWQACVEWGKRRGAQLCGRVRPQIGRKHNEILEQIVWRVI